MITPSYARLPKPAPFDALWSYRHRPASDLNVVRAARAAIVWRTHTGRAALRHTKRYGEWARRFPFELRRALATHGAGVKQHIGRGYAGQIADMVRVGVVSGLMPADYYAGSLARHRGGPDIFRYIPYAIYETVATHLLVDRDAATARLASDKLAFEQRCGTLGLAVVRTIAVVRGDGWFLPGGGAFGDAMSLGPVIVKPRSGGQGKGVTAWRRVEADRFVGADGVELSTASFIAHLSALAIQSGSALLVQERLQNNAELGALAGSALSTTRFVTYLNEEGEPEIVEAFYRSSIKPNAAVDNFHGGGVLFPVELQTGRLRGGCSESHDALEAIVDHPETGVAMAGRVVPGWAAMSAFALRVHRAFPDLVMAGWDVAYAPSGPVLVEANTPPGITAKRQGAAGPLVGSRLFELLAFHASQWLQRTEPAGSRWRPQSAS